MPVTVYKSSDTGAPAIDGLAGSLIAVLDACLVNGYGAKAAAGWTKPFTGANQGCYRNAATGTNHYLQVNDNAPNATAIGREAQCRGFEAMTSQTTGTGPFPTTTQLAAAIVVRKSATPDGTVRPWIVIADDKTMYLFINTPDFIGWTGFHFGDIFSLKGIGDTWRSMITGRSVVASDLDTDERLPLLVAGAGISATSATTGQFMPRSHRGFTQSSTIVGKHGDGNKGSTIGLFGIVQYPNPVDNSLMLSAVTVVEDNGNTIGVRGRMRGFWQFLHPVAAPVEDGDTFAGTGELAGKTFLVIKPTADSTGLYIIETSDTWETN